jgi:hypothetical protein
MPADFNSAPVFKNDLKSQHKADPDGATYRNKNDRIPVEGWKARLGIG